MRRSRLQVKPNVGLKAGSRNKSDDKTSVAASKSPKPTSKNKEPQKHNDKVSCESSVGPVGKEDDVNTIGKNKEPQKHNDTVSCESSVGRVGKEDDVNTVVKNKEPQKHNDTVSCASSVEPVGKEDDANTVEVGHSGFLNKLTRLKNKQPSVENISLSGSPTKSPPVQNDAESKSATRLRSRFPKKLKPNLSVAGRALDRKSISSSDKHPSSQSEGRANSPKPEVTTSAVSIAPTTEISTDDVICRTSVDKEVADCIQTQLEVLTSREKAVHNETELSQTVVSEPIRKSKRRPPKILAPVDEPPDRCKMLMKDLIYWNPSKNPMRVKEKQPKDPSCKTSTEDETVTEEAAPVDESLPVPQVKIGPDGSIILNEESLVIDRKSDHSELSDIGVLDESDVVSTYSSYRNRHLSKTWSEKETERFYYALSIVGTDFSMMCNLFKRRNRCDLKKKFKREEKHNRPLIDKALRERKSFDMSVFEDISDEGEDENVKKMKQREKVISSSIIGRGKRKGQNGKPRKGKTKMAKKRRKSQYYSEDSEVEELPALDSNEKPVEDLVATPKTILDLEDDDDDELRTVAKKDMGGSSDEEECKLMESICQTTRSGRKPKRSSFYTSLDPLKKVTSRKLRKSQSSVSQGTDPVQDTPRGRISTQETDSLEGASVDFDKASNQGATAVSTGDDSMEIHTLQNIPSVGGSQIVLVTQKGEGTSGQGTVIHVYMMSPTSSRTPEWSPKHSPHVYPSSPHHRVLPTSSNSHVSPKPIPQTPTASSQSGPQGNITSPSPLTQNTSLQPNVLLSTEGSVFPLFQPVQNSLPSELVEESSVEIADTDHIFFSDQNVAEEVVLT